MTKHARLGPSNPRWVYCPGSIREEAKYPYQESSEAAIDGTGSHLLLEMCLNEGVDADAYDQKFIGAGHKDNPMGWLVDRERCDRVQIGINYVDRRIAELEEQYPGCDVTVELETLSDPGKFFGRDDWWGTVDITITAFKGNDVYFVEVVDYKDGRGYVSEKGNTQLHSYLYGKIGNLMSSKAMDSPALKSFVIEHGFRMTIVQPKTSTPIRYMDSSRDGITLLDIHNTVCKYNESATATDKPDAPLSAGKHCQWCKHNPKKGGNCIAETGASVGALMSTGAIANDSVLDVMTKAVEDVKSLTVEQLTMLADSEAGFLAAFNKVKTEIQDRIEMGETVQGFAMLPGRAKKVWNFDEETIEKKLKAKRMKKADIYPAKLITPAAALKHEALTPAQRKGIEKDLIAEVAGNLTLKKVSYDHKPEKTVDSLLEQADKVIEPTNNEVSFF